MALNWREISGRSPTEDKRWIDLSAYRLGHSAFEWAVTRLWLVSLAGLKLALVSFIAAILLPFSCRIVLLRGDSIGPLVVSTSNWLTHIDRSPSARRTLALPFTWVCNQEIWLRFNGVNPHVGFVRSRFLLSILAWFGNAHNGYTLAIHRKLSEKVPIFRNIMFTPEYDFGGLEFSATLVINRKSPLCQTISSEEIEAFRSMLAVPRHGKLMLIVDRDSSTGIAGNLRNTPTGYVESIASMLVSGGWYAVRGGRKRAYEIRLPSSKWIDYPFSGLASDKNDLLLAASADAAIGWLTGLTDLPIYLDKPTLVFSHFVPRALPNVLNSLRYVLSQEGRILPGWSGDPREHLPYRDLAKALQLMDTPTGENNGIRPMDLSLDECLHEVQEFLLWCDHEYHETPTPKSLLDSLNQHSISNLRSHGELRYLASTVRLTKRSIDSWRQM